MLSGPQPSFLVAFGQINQKKRESATTSVKFLFYFYISEQSFSSGQLRPKQVQMYT